MSETPQRHSHTSPGDGGELDLEQAKSGSDRVLKELASGTTTIADETDTTISTGVSGGERTVFVAIGFDDETQVSSNTAEIEFTRNPGDNIIGYTKTYDGPNDDWVIRIHNREGTQITFAWSLLGVR